MSACAKSNKLAMSACAKSTNKLGAPMVGGPRSTWVDRELNGYRNVAVNDCRRKICDCFNGRRG